MWSVTKPEVKPVGLPHRLAAAHAAFFHWAGSPSSSVTPLLRQAQNEPSLLCSFGWFSCVSRWGVVGLSASSDGRCFPARHPEPGRAGPASTGPEGPPLVPVSLKPPGLQQAVRRGVKQDVTGCSRRNGSEGSVGRNLFIRVQGTVEGLVKMVAVE